MSSRVHLQTDGPAVRIRLSGECEPEFREVLLPERAGCRDQAIVGERAWLLYDPHLEARNLELSATEQPQ